MKAIKLSKVTEVRLTVKKKGAKKTCVLQMTMMTIQNLLLIIYDFIHSIGQENWSKKLPV